MTSYYARHHSLSRETRDAYTRCVDEPNRISLKLRFYLYYLQDVVPYGINVNHVPTGRSNPPREQIELRTFSNEIFMLGLVSTERNSDYIEHDAAGRARLKYQGGHFVDDDNAWRFFTGLDQLRFYNCYGGPDYELMGILPPVRDVREVAAYLQRQYDSLRQH